MIGIIRAELGRLLRPRTAIGAGAAAVVFAVVTTIAVYASVTAAGPASARGTSIAALSASGGASRAFAIGASFVGAFVFVTFIALFGTEFSGGTYRALLLRNPHRVRLIAGKLIGALVVAAAALALTEVLSIVLSLVLAPGKDVDTGAWFSASGLGHAVVDYLTALLGVAGWAVFGVTLAAIFRTVPLAVGVGFAWAGPIENIVAQSWSTGYRTFPGQLLNGVIEGGNTEISFGRALLFGLLYVGVAVVATTTLLTRRDVTS